MVTACGVGTAKFFYAVAEHYPGHAFLLVGQNQPHEGGCKLNDLCVMIARVHGLIDKALVDYPDVRLWLWGIRWAAVSYRTSILRRSRRCFGADYWGRNSEAYRALWG